MNSRNIDTLGSALAEAMMQAAAAEIRSRGLTADSIDLDAVVVAIRAESKGLIDRILDSGRALVETGNRGWLGTLAQTECVAAGRAAVAAVAAVAATQTMAALSGE
jgi:hypothetical protein